MNIATNKLTVKCFSIHLKLTTLFKQRYQKCFYIERINSCYHLRIFNQKVKPKLAVPLVAQQVKNLTSIHKDAGSILETPLFSGLRIWHYHELGCRSQTWLRSGVVDVAQAGSCSSDATPCLEISTYLRWGPEKNNKKKVNQSQV